MKKTLEHILQNYEVAKLSNYGGNDIARYIRQDAKEVLFERASLNEATYLVEGSAGRGNWADIPWLAVFDKDITITATKGYDIVYLFRADMTGVYLSLNQGWTFFKDTYGTKGGREKIKAVANAWRNLLSSALNDFSVKEIDLRATNGLGEGYELGHICGKFYEFGKIPDDSVLINDLRNLLGVYRELKGHLGNRSIAEMAELLYTNQKIKKNLLDEEENEDKFQILVNTIEPSETPLEPQPKPTIKKSGNKEEYPRNPKISREALEFANYLCEIDCRHLTFTSSVTGKNFVEAHHLIPMRFQDYFENSLDVPGNIVALCPNCHRQIHLAEASQKVELIAQLFEKHQESLQRFGINVTVTDLHKMYEVPTV
ncbi:MrcB family domain-containing protein [Brevibacillus fortis]|uniref:MrcB family domain-containing protein n=1 Tax=Brevibacillus fortis TaxID=2126352 RepID=UPI0038FBFD54